MVGLGSGLWVADPLFLDMSPEDRHSSVRLSFQRIEARDEKTCNNRRGAGKPAPLEYSGGDPATASPSVDSS